MWICYLTLQWRLYRRVKDLELWRYPGISGWTQCGQKGPYKREAAGSIKSRCDNGSREREIGWNCTACWLWRWRKGPQAKDCRWPSLAGYSPWGRKSWTQLSDQTSTTQKLEKKSYQTPSKSPGGAQPCWSILNFWLPDWNIINLWVCGNLILLQ